MKNARTYLQECYLDFLNNYLTVERWAEHNGMTVPDAVTFLVLAKNTLESNHPDE